MKREFDPVRKPYTLSILVRDIPGVLSQVARLFSRKGYNIESIVSGETDRPGVTRITIVLLADELMVNQIAAQCRKLIPVLAVKILEDGTSIRREFAGGRPERPGRGHPDGQSLPGQRDRREPGHPDSGHLRRREQDLRPDRTTERFRDPGDRKDRYYRYRKSA